MELVKSNDAEIFYSGTSACMPQRSIIGARGFFAHTLGSISVGMPFGKAHAVLPGRMLTSYVAI